MENPEQEKFEQTYVLNLINQLVDISTIEKLVNDRIERINTNKWIYGQTDYIKPFYVNDVEIYRRAFTHKSLVDEQRELKESGKMEAFIQAKNDILAGNTTFIQLPDDTNYYSFQQWVLSGKDTVGYIPTDSNERLEYLGDGIIKSCQGTYIYNRFPGKAGFNNEGFMTKLRIKLEKTERLSEFAQFLGFGNFLLYPDYLEKLSSKDQGRNNPKALENAFEAFIGAIIQDNKQNLGDGYLFAFNFIKGVMEECADFNELITKNDNFKDSLIKYLSKNRIRCKKNGQGKSTPSEIIFFKGPPNDRTFMIAMCLPIEYIESLDDKVKNSLESYREMMETLVLKNAPVPENDTDINGRENWNRIKNTVVGVGTGTSKIKAEQLAAKKALCHLGIPLNY